MIQIENCQNLSLNCQNHGVDGLKDFTEEKAVSSKRFDKINDLDKMKKVKNQNHGLRGLMDFTDYKTIKSKNLWHLSNQNKSVVQTKSADILNSILELI